MRREQSVTVLTKDFAIGLCHYKVERTYRADESKRIQT